MMTTTKIFWGHNNHEVTVSMALFLTQCMYGCHHNIVDTSSVSVSEFTRDIFDVPCLFHSLF